LLLRLAANSLIPAINLRQYNHRWCAIRRCFFVLNLTIFLKYQMVMVFFEGVLFPALTLILHHHLLYPVFQLFTGELIAAQAVYYNGEGKGRWFIRMGDDDLLMVDALE